MPSTQSDQLRLLLISKNMMGSDRLLELLHAAGAKVEQSQFGTEADRAIQTVEFEVLVLHIVDFGEVMEQLRNWRDRGLKAPALVVCETGSTCPTTLNSGVVATISESIEPAEFLSRLTAIRRLCRGESPVIEVFDLRIDSLSRTVVRGGRSIGLTPREFGVLELLATQRGKVVSRRSILDRVFGITDFHSSNVVDVYIRTLRQKIDRDSSIKLIETRRGYGYLLRQDDDIESMETAKPPEGNS